MSIQADLNSSTLIPSNPSLHRTTTIHLPPRHQAVMTTTPSAGMRPPMRMRSADASRDALQSEAKQSEATIPTIRPVKHKDPADEDLEKATTSGQHKIKRKSTSSSSSESETTIMRRPIDEVSPPTPGVDDTPYIQFAIDQLTRDEEVVGPRHENLGSEASYPVDRIVPDQGLGYYDQRLQGQRPTLKGDASTHLVSRCLPTL